MSKNSINILHLSDLHISEDNNKISTELEKLLKDIEKQIKEYDKIIVIVSGDIVNQGNYNKCERTIEFFSRLKKILGKKFLKIFIVPGNHDKIRNEYDNSILSNDKDEKSANNLEKWNYHELCFEKYKELSSRIYSLFNIKKDSEMTFGVDLLKIEEHQVCFVQCNTAWAATGKCDEYNLMIGEYQMEQISSEYKNKIHEKELDLTIVIGHHPLSWLRSKEAQLFKKVLTSESGLNANIYMFGHIHDSKMDSWYNNEHSLLTLSTGTGWPDKRTEENQHCYSIYEIHLDTNSVDVIMRKSQGESEYVYDFKAYRNLDSENRKKITFPLKMKAAKYFIPLNSCMGDHVYPLALNESIIRMIPMLSNFLGNLRFDIANLFFDYKQDILEFELDEQKKEILNDYFFKEQENNQIKAILDEYKSNIYDNFEAYLKEICTTLLNDVFAPLSIHGQDESIIRTHFRCLKLEEGAEDRYPMFCSSELKKDSIQPYGSSLSERKWGELIKKAFDLKSPLIYSLNSSAVDIPINADKWDDFITIVPEILDNVYTCKKNHNVAKKRPWFTFGITGKKNDISSILYILEFLGISKIIGNMINDYLEVFHITLKEFMNYYNNRNI